MNHLQGIRDMVAKVTGALRVSATFARSEHAGASPQDSFSVTQGKGALSPAGQFTANAMPGKVDLTDLPGDLMGLELQMYTVAAQDCLFPIARGMIMTINDGPIAGVKLPVMHVSRRAADAAVNVYTKAVSGSASLPSSGEED